MINIDKDALIFYDSKYQNFILYLYIKLNKNQLKKALPISYLENSYLGYLTAIFVNGSDYLSQDNYYNISEYIKHNNMISIFKNNYNFIKQIYPNFDKKTYNTYLYFSKEQFKI